MQGDSALFEMSEDLVGAVACCRRLAENAAVREQCWLGQRSPRLHRRLRDTPAYRLFSFSVGFITATRPPLEVCRKNRISPCSLRGLCVSVLKLPIKRCTTEHGEHGEAFFRQTPS